MTFRDPHADTVPAPDHAHDDRGHLVYDARCWWCRQVTAQAPPGTQPGHAAIYARYLGPKEVAADG